MRDPGSDCFVGRAEQLSRLRTHAERAEAGEPRLVLVVGDPGVGKTSLIDRAVERLDGFQVLRGSGEESETDISFALLGQMFGDRMTIQAGMAREPFAVGSDLLDVLSRLQDSGAVALIVDDAHTADLASLQALLFALRRLRADRVLGVLVARTELECRLPAGIARQLDVGSNERIPLLGLAESQVDSLLSALGAELPRRAVRRLWEHTLGNPLWVRALVEELSVEQLTASDLALPAPVSFARGVDRRMSNCSPEARGFVEAVSVAGGSTPLGVLGRIAELVDPFPALDEATRNGLLRSRGTPPALQVSFPHALVGAAVYDGLDAAARAALHRRSAALAEDDAVRMRHQVAACPGPDEQLASRVADHARRQRESGALGTAATAFCAAARLTPRRVEQDQMLLEAAEAWLMVGQAGEAAELLDRLSRDCVSPRRDVIDGWMALSAGQTGEATLLLERAWRAAEPDDLPLRATAGRLLAGLYLLRGRGDDCVTWAARTASVASSEWERHGAASTRAIGLAIAGRSHEALTALDWLADGEEWGANDLSGAAARGGILLWADRLDDLRTNFLRLLAAALRCGSFQLHSSTLAHLSEVEHRAGNWDDAIAYGERSIKHAEDTDQMHAVGSTHAMTSHCYARRGQWAIAAEHVHEATRHCSNFPGNPSAVAYAADAAVLLAHSRADWAGAVVAAEPLLQMWDIDGPNEPGIFEWRQLYAEALVRLGQPAAAETALAPYERVAAERGRRSAMGAAARVRGLLHARGGDLAAADEAFEEAVGHANAAGLPFERALAQLAHGGALRRAGLRRAAVERLTAAAGTFAELRAEPFDARASQELRGCGQTRTRRSLADNAELTPQERSVAVLVASGLTNRDVASQLVLSVKTVEFHLGHVFAKLGLRSRSQLARRFAESANTDN